ncbi:double-stranded RNA-binding protein Staufen homolog 1-like isoform X1 [Sinocyclocheilus anshuiensis]|uniref:Double-stranded RNA-binding protein Staufen homolog 1 n=1 Tax=Sinocyclocheilus anshuiensis TaxID=1608454 RepID=A0A671SCE8_9TELE|nr:PREDICTED: double-stranded RNA-binding protein Staufen homolog 1-like isoform X1 [Sinocyclocheilus anshuiensis]XP_016332196.1 PREDICTED: double-stranded RNA-binding protein Staufen homolog 1-like isoform X1 [Sinocyclocheilus anshuiensis]XP_016332197.1 PREDICTED: double-stranded RNA-binding protein Staufen homolog 1-like isoform X1 [Sinocyclocheilus anshuiensis]
MSQLQFQAPGNPAPSATPLQLAPPQPGFSIPCATAPLPSESASHPLRNSALPSASATPFCNPTVSNMANPKEKTPMCLVNELARYNKIQPEYKLLSEQGPAHSKIFSVRLTLGDQHWDAEGTSIKKAQHSAATCALTQTTLPKPSHRSPRHPGKNPGGIYKGSEYNVTHTVELNALCMKLGKKPIYKPIDAYPGLRPAFNYNIRAPGPYARSMQHYYYPFPPVGPVLYQMELSIGGQQFHGKGRTRQAAKHDAAAKAIKYLQKEPIMQQIAEMKEEPVQENLNKSEISQVFEIALKRNMPVNFEVLKETGPPHMKNFVVRVTVGEFSGEGEGKSKKIAKKLAAIAVLEELRILPQLPVIDKIPLRIKKKSKSIIKLQTSPEYGQGMNPISRLAQIQQSKKEKEPEYTLVTERGLPRRREFVMQVSVASQNAEGMGPSKKVAKRNAAEKMLELLGFKVPQPQPPKPALKMDEKAPAKKTGDGRKVTFFEPGSVEKAGIVNKEEDFRVPFLSHQQLPAGILPMVPEVAQAVGANQGPHAKDYCRTAAPNPAKTTVTAMIANELLYAGTSPTAEGILKTNNSLPHRPHGPLSRPSEQLSYLATIQGLQVEYKDFPKNNKNEFVSLINCSSQPPLISHGIGKEVESCHDMAALNILKLLSELDQQSNERTANGPMTGCNKQDLEGDALLKPANSSTIGKTLDGTV